MQVAFTNPNPPPSHEEQISTTSERVLKVMIMQAVVVLKGLFWMAALADATIILALQVPSLSISRVAMSALVLEGSAGISHLAVTPLSIFGSLLIIFGALLRYQCYQTLGKLFTFELSIRNDHKLVTTGPYAVVRHPSYTGAIMALTGAIFSKTTHGSWLRECGAWDSVVGKVLVWSWMIAAVSTVCGVVFRRIPGEDAAMKKQFGKEWDAWARRVRYRLIPGIY